MSDLTYPRYLELDQLLDLQQVRSDPPEHDEMLFIVIHQVYELWFKLLLHELEKVESDFIAGTQWGAHATLGRCRTILKTLVGQLDILETMTPRSFNSFRERLETSSGFQSVQFREIETFLGYKRPGMLEHWPEHLEGLDQRRRRAHLGDGEEGEAAVVGAALRLGQDARRAQAQVMEAQVLTARQRLMVPPVPVVGIRLDPENPESDDDSDGAPELVDNSD